MSSAREPLKRPYRLRILPLAICVFTSIWIIITVGFAWEMSTQSTFEKTIIQNIGASTVLALLRFFTEVLNILLLALIASTLDAVMWALASTRRGIAVSTLLGLSTSTGMGGLIELFFKWRRGYLHRWVAAIR
jgi:hypothetical protein